MKVTDWTVYEPDVLRHVFIELHTDAGISVWGAAFSSRPQCLGALEWLKKFVVGENPLEVERVTEKLHQMGNANRMTGGRPQRAAGVRAHLRPRRGWPAHRARMM